MSTLNRTLPFAAALAVMAPVALLAQDACAGWMSNCAAVELTSQSDDLVVYVPNAYTEASETPRKNAVEGLSEAERLYLEAIGANLFEGAGSPPTGESRTDALTSRATTRRSARPAPRGGLTIARLSYGHGCSPSSWFACVDIARAGGTTDASGQRGAVGSAPAGASAYYSFRLGHPVLAHMNRSERGRSGDAIPTTVTFRSPSDRRGPSDRPAAGPSDAGSSAPQGPDSGGTPGTGPSDAGGNAGANASGGAPANDSPGSSGSDTSPAPGDLLPIPTNTPPMASVPEPISTTLVSLGLLGYAGVRARRRRQESLIEEEE